MNYCPPLNGFKSDAYFHILLVISYISPVINAYAIFCILFRSKRHMTVYRYLLLKHQLLGFAMDFTMSTIVKPILILPFPGGFTNGILSSISAHYYAIAIFLMTCWLQVSTIHLFDCRYLLATGRQMFPNSHKIAFSLMYFVYCYPGFSFVLALEDQNIVLQRLQQEYSCFTDEIANIPGLIIYDPSKIAKLLCFPLIPFILFTGFMNNFLIILTKRSLQNTSLSAKGAKLQKRFLIQLCIQVTVPLIFILLPGAANVYIIAAQVFNVQVPGFFLLISLSMYGALGAIVLIALNPPYYIYSCCVNRKTEVKVLAKLSPTTTDKY